MPFTFSSQAKIAFKSIFGKAHTSDLRDVYNEPYGLSTNIHGRNVWLDPIPLTASLAVAQGLTVRVRGSLVRVGGDLAAFLYWPNTPPTGLDVKTGLPFQYGRGSLIGLTGGSRMTNIINDSYGTDYYAAPLGPLNAPTSPLDFRDWLFQPTTGLYYQQDLGSFPTLMDVYPYLGRIVEIPNQLENIRLTATGTNGYFATFSTPMIATYSRNYLYLVEFNNSNTGAITLNINNIGTVSVFKNGNFGTENLVSGDITGSTGLGPMYYLTYNGSNFEFFNSNPTPEPDTFTNLIPTLQTVGGINQGSYFYTVANEDMFKNFLYPGDLGNIVSFQVSGTAGQITQFEVGDSFVPQFVTFSWGLTNSVDFYPFTARIEEVGAADLLTSGDNSTDFGVATTGTISFTESNTKNYVLHLLRNNGTWITKTLPIEWKWGFFVGSTTSATLSSAGILQLDKTLFTQSEFTTSITGTGYKYIAYPESYPTLYSLTVNSLPLAIAGTAEGYTFSETKLGSFNTSITSVYFTKVDVLNTFGVTASYRVYRSKNQINGNLDVVSRNNI